MTLVQIIGASILISLAFVVLVWALCKLQSWGGPWAAGAAMAFMALLMLTLGGCAMGIPDADSSIPKPVRKVCEVIVTDAETGRRECISRAEAERRIYRPLGNTW